MKRLGIVVSHPIQYHSPLFRYMAKRLDLVVFYCHRPTEAEIGNTGFGKSFQWDVDLLSGYQSVFLENISTKPSLNAFSGCDTPSIGEKLKEYHITHLVIFGWYLKSYIQALIQAKKLGIKVGVRGDSQLNPNENKLKRLLKQLFYPYLLKQYDVLFYVGERNKQYLLSYGSKPKQLDFAPHAVDQEFWKMDSPINRPIRRFIWIGKFIEKKRPLDVIEAFIAINKNIEGAELWMVGSGDLLDECKLFAKDCSNVKFLGFQNQTELRKTLMGIDCLILCSDYGETWGLVVNECFAMGIPAIVSSACGCSEDLITNGVTGFCFEYQSLNELKQRLLEVTKYSTVDFSAGIKGKNKRYSYNTNTQAFENFILLGS